MNDETTTLEQADEEILTYTFSDEALEAVGGTERGAAPSFLFCPDTQQQWRFGCLDQADEEILTSTLSDEALEAAAGEGGGW